MHRDPELVAGLFDPTLRTGGDSITDGSARSSFKPVCVQLRYTELLFLNVHL